MAFFRATCSHTHNCVHRLAFKGKGTAFGCAVALCSRKQVVISQIAFSALVIFSATGTYAQTYPTKPIRLLVGFAPGGSTDTISRIVTPRLSERLGQQVIVENRPGAAGNIAAELAAKAAPDGYTVFMASASLTINASLYSRLPFDAITDFAAITLVCSSPFILVVHPSVPAKSLELSAAQAQTLLERLGNLPETRSQQGRRHRLQTALAQDLLRECPHSASVSALR